MEKRRAFRIASVVAGAALLMGLCWGVGRSRVGVDYANIGAQMADDGVGAPRGKAMEALAPSTPSGSPSEGVAMAAPAPAQADRKVIMTAEVTLQVKEFTKTHAALLLLARRMEGYVAASELNLPDEGTQSGTVTLRIPQERYQDALAGIRDLGKVVSESQGANDVTDKYVDLDARVRNLKAEEERILDIMKRARTIKDTLQVEQTLSAVRERIEVLEGQLRLLKYQVAMATITVTLSEAATALHLPQPQWVWLNHVKSAWHSAVVSGQAVVTVVTYGAVIGAFWVLPVGVVILVARKARRRPKKL